MKERIEEILSGVEVDETRLLTEVGIFADKVNITEEIIRFESHLKEYAHLLESDVPVGRKLDFIIQELNRETNTMGSKCNDYTISKTVVELKSEIEKLRELGFSSLPVCMAKTQYSFSDDPLKLGAPENFTVTIKKVKVSAGAGFIVALTGDIMTMPGLPKVPAAEKIDVDENGVIHGLF
jgi:formate--tetrahydrofolate ligase